MDTKKPRIVSSKSCLWSYPNRKKSMEITCLNKSGKMLEGYGGGFQEKGHSLVNKTQVG